MTDDGRRTMNMGKVVYKPGKDAEAPSKSREGRLQDR